MIKRLPLILISAMILSIFLNSLIPLDVKRIIYSLSITLKSCVSFLLPFIIFSLLFKTFVKLADHAFSVIIMIFGTLCVSNFFNTFISHYIGSILYAIDFNLDAIPKSTLNLEPYFVFVIPSLIKNEVALIGGICCGLLAASFNKQKAIQISNYLFLYTKKIFAFIAYLIPLFIIGFVIKCASEDTLVSILKNYLQILFIFLIYATVYTLLIYFIINKCNYLETRKCLKNMWPAFLTAFSTISSVVTMPVTILAAEKNAKDKELSGSVISATVNIHLLGDCLSIPILAYALLKNYGLAEPSLSSYIVFTFFFVIAKFSVAAVPAGGIIIMTPLLEKYLNFSPEMSTLIITIYIVFDPFVTAFNVLGNGALAKLIDNISNKLNK